MTNKVIQVRMDDESYRQWLEVCDIFKGSTRSSVFRKLIKRIHQASIDAFNLNEYE